MRLVAIFVFIFISGGLRGQLLMNDDRLQLNESRRSFGVSFSGSMNSAISGGVFYGRKSRLHLSFCLQDNGQAGKKIDEQLSNYGTAIRGDGKYFESLDVGYSHIIRRVFTVYVEASLGKENTYTNYFDDRFKGGGYYLVTMKEHIRGAGFNLGYILPSDGKLAIEIHSGYHSMKQFNIGLRVILHSS